MVHWCCFVLSTNWQPALVGAKSLRVEMSNADLKVGERVMLIDAKDRNYLITLREGAAFHTHAGIVQHNDLIGVAEGSLVRGSTYDSFLVLRPTLADVVLKMPRGAQVIYPKDLGTILMQADIGPGMRVLEAGIGSGALSMTLLRAGAIITGYEIRPDFAEHAIKNVHDLLGDDVAYDIHIRDVTQGIDEVELDRIILDMPEPHPSSWRRDMPIRSGNSRSLSGEITLQMNGPSRKWPRTSTTPTKRSSASRSPARQSSSSTGARGP